MGADLFRHDRRTTTNGTAGERGSGLRLLLSRDLVERQGDNLAAESLPGQGTTFRFTLPEAVAQDRHLAPSMP
jgi:two-component system sensor histidine kinase/response regulator